MQKEYFELRDLSNQIDFYQQTPFDQPLLTIPNSPEALYYLLYLYTWVVRLVNYAN